VAEEAKRDTVNFLEESRDMAIKRSARYQQALQRYHARIVHPRAFQVRDLVLRRIQAKKGKHKLSSPWEGPYLIAELLRPGVYQL
jgi:hypothetical protein